MSNTASEPRDLAYYRSLPYIRKVEKVRDGEDVYFVCRYPELPGLAADGDTRAEAVKNAADAFDDYIGARLHFADPIPEPPEAGRVAHALELASDRASTAALSVVLEAPTVIVNEKIRKTMLRAALRRPAPVTRTDTPSTRIHGELVTAGSH